jgi:hypothetical protein
VRPPAMQVGVMPDLRTGRWICCIIQVNLACRRSLPLLTNPACNQDRIPVRKLNAGRGGGPIVLSNSPRGCPNHRFGHRGIFGSRLSLRSDTPICWLKWRFNTPDITRKPGLNTPTMSPRLHVSLSMHGTSP